MMDGSDWVLPAAASFVGTHFLLSHPLRRALVAAMGEKGFAGVYSLVAAVTLGLTVWAYRAAPITVPWWPVGDALWAAASVAMLAAAVLLMGSLIRNPALPGAQAQAATAQARGVFAITRHPMMWSFAIWGGAHVLIWPITANIELCAAIVLLSLLGAAMQDRKKRALDPQGWAAWQAHTSYWPFAAVARGRARLDGFGAHALAGGAVLWLAATWAHIPLAGWPAGIWRWIG